MASTSLARRTILAAAGVAFEVVAPDVDEDAVKALLGSAREIAEALARLKSLTAHAAKGVDPSSDPLRGPPSPARGEGLLVIGSDQTLEFDGRSFSKAASIDELRANLIRLRGRTHSLHAAVAVARDGVVVWSHTATAHLTMRAFSDAYLDDYIGRHGERVRSSLGGYWFEAEGAQLFEAVDGDYFTILGLPLIPLLGFLREAGVLAA